jgi:hypothetical protein
MTYYVETQNIVLYIRTVETTTDERVDLRSHVRERAD